MSSSVQFRCPCGWTIITPLGSADAMRNGHLHLAENHPEMIMLSLEDMRREFLTEVRPELLTVNARRPF